MFKIKKTNKEFLNELKNAQGDRITALEEYKGIDTKIRFRCNIDGYEWYAIPYTPLGGHGCPCCTGVVCVENINSVYKLRSDLIKYFKNEQDAKTHTVKSGNWVQCICPNCGLEKRIKVSNLANYAFHCDRCSDKISFPNRFIANLLKKINIVYELERSFEWSKKKRYDAYIPNYQGKNVIIENQGIQHSNGGFKHIGGRDLEEELRNDKIKKNLALENNVDEYIEIYFYNRYNTLDNFIEAILISKFNTIFDLTEIDWISIWKQSQKSLVIQVWGTWNNWNNSVDGIRSTVSIGKIYGLNRTTIARYLKSGVDANKVKYDPMEEQKSSRGKIGSKHPRSKKIICLNTKEIFESINLARNKHKLNAYLCSDKKVKFVSLKDIKQVWIYYKDYINMTKIEIKNCITLVNKEANMRTISFTKSNTKVTCLNTNETFSCAMEASRKYNIKKYQNIEECCKKNNKSCGVLPNNEKLIWRYYEEYKNMNMNQISTIIKEMSNRKIESKKIICLNTKEVFECGKDAGEYYYIKSYSHIDQCCQGERNTCGVLPNGEKLKWGYLNDLTIDI